MTTLARVLTSLGLLCIALITLVSPGATRMWATPWNLALWAGLTLPAVALSVRAFDRQRPLVLPAASWLWSALACAAIVVGSALTSPYGGISLRWSAPLLAGVAVWLVAFDEIHYAAGNPAQRRDALARLALASALIVAATSIGFWVTVIVDAGLRTAIASRNAFPLGHSNYTAGLALLILPFAAHEAWRRRGLWCAIAGIAALLAGAMLFSSGSRGGFLGIAALVAVGLWQSSLSAQRKWQLALGAVAAGVALIALSPRARATFTRGQDAHLVAASEVQRRAMAEAGVLMGRDRPPLGWGPGTTPLVYPRYRASLEGGAENVLQLHSLPLQLWADLGLGGAAALLVFGFLAWRARRRSAIAFVTLAGYAAFALSDWQLDIPIFAVTAAALAAALAPPRVRPPTPGASRWVGGATVGIIALVALVGRRDPTPALNVRALILAREPAHADQAIALLQKSLDLNPHQEIALFNLGWLLVVRDPTQAERYFLGAAHTVPDKGGVYFGLGLARLNQGKNEAAAHAFALECLNDPAFLHSPWWRQPEIAATREAAARHFTALLAGLPAHFRTQLPAPPAELGRVPPGAERNYRRQRTGYPVLMRDLDLPTPVDLFDVREAVERAGAGSLPPKGWLPSPLLLKLLDAPLPASLTAKPTP